MKIPLLAGLVILNLVIVVIALAYGVGNLTPIDGQEKEVKFMDEIVSGQINPSKEELLGTLNLVLKQNEERAAIVNSTIDAWIYITVVLAATTVLQGVLIYEITRNRKHNK